MPTLLEKLKSKAVANNQLLSVTLELTYRCNLDCFICYNDRDTQGQLLSLKQYRSLLLSLQKMQVMFLTLTGGEPMLHPEFWPIAQYAHDLGFVVRLKTNGHALNDKLALKLREEVDPSMVDISIHGASADTHDRQTKVPGSFTRLMRNLEILNGYGVKVNLMMTISQWNFSELERIQSLADSLGFHLDASSTITPRDNGDRMPQSISISSEQTRQLISPQTDRLGTQAVHFDNNSQPVSGTLNKENTAATKADEPPVNKQCGSGSSILVIDPYGHVYPCMQLRRLLGNIHHQSIEEIWSHSPSLKEVRDLSAAAKQLVDSYGEGSEYLGYCMGLAELATGDPVKIYPQAQQHFELTRKLQRERILKKLSRSVTLR
ncbi:MAG: radical SAM protein [Gammaproteobacteria bacterium]|nr:radical SAM protein [Gammaproteobacteria bacterium]